MSRFNLELDTGIITLYAVGTYTTNDYISVNIIFHNVSSDNQSIDDDILISFKHFIKKVMINYINELDFKGNMNGNVLDYLTDMELLDSFLFEINQFESK